MKAKLIKEFYDIPFKSKSLEETKEYLDSLSLKDLVIYMSGRELVTNEGYGGENKLDFVPNYVIKRINKESTNI